MARTTNFDSPLLRLPEELLGSILLKAAHFTPPNPWLEVVKDPYGPATKLSLVCCDFHRIVTPYLYADFWAKCSHTHTEETGLVRTQLFHRTLKENPSLRPYCRKLGISVGYGMPPRQGGAPFNVLLQAVVDLVTWLSGTTELWIDQLAALTAPAQQSRLLNLAGYHMPRLENLELISGLYAACASLPTLSVAFGGLGPNSCLRKLDIWGVSVSGKPIDWGNLKGKAGTSSITELKLGGFLQSSEALEALVRWPAKLESFTFRMPMSGYYSGETALSKYSLAVLQPILAHQKASLSYVQIAEIFNDGLEGFDVTDFPNLQFLSLSHDLTGLDTTLVPNLVAPGLRIFRWDMKLEDQQCGERLGDFCEPQETWLRVLVATAVERKTALREIRINFRPEGGLQGHHGFTQDQYPWDRMDKLANEFRPHGIDLTYNPPNHTREEFQAYLDAPGPDIAALNQTFFDHQA